MAIKIDPPKRIGITGDRTEYLIGYLSELTRQITFELSVCHRQIEETDEGNLEKLNEIGERFNEIDEKFSAIDAQIATLQAQLEAADAEEEA